MEASGTLEYPQSVFDPILRNEQLHSGCPPFHGGVDTDDGRGHAGGIQGDPRNLGVDACRVGLDDLHDDWPTQVKSSAHCARFFDLRSAHLRRRSAPRVAGPIRYDARRSGALVPVTIQSMGTSCGCGKIVLIKASA
jgi:hypothetical protein